MKYVCPALAWHIRNSEMLNALANEYIFDMNDDGMKLFAAS